MRDIPLQIDLNKVLAEKCRRNFHFFIKYFWDTIIAEKLIDNWHIKYLADEMQNEGERVAQRLPKNYDYIIINIPPGSSKSTIVSEMYPLWCWTIDPTQRFICGSYAATPAEDIADKCFKIYNSEKYRALFPNLHGKNKSGGKTNFKNGLMGERYTTSTGSGITGIHAHQKILDDPMNPEIARSDLERERANRWLTETIGSRNIDDDITLTWIVMQRLHEMDTTGYALSLTGLRIKHICIPAELSDLVRPMSLSKFYKDGLFDPVRRPRQSLDKMKIQLGSRGYAGQYEQAPTTPGGNIIKEEWFKYITRDKFNQMRNPKKSPFIFFGDTAYTDSEDNDPTGMIATCQMDGKVYITAAEKVRKNFPDLIKWMPGWVKVNGYTASSSVRIEPKASGKSTVQQLKLIPGLNITETPTPVDSKETRLESVSARVECGNVVLVMDAWNDEFVDEVCGFPGKAHDEYVDLLCYAIDYHIDGEIKTTTEEKASYFAF